MMSPSKFQSDRKTDLRSFARSYDRTIWVPLESAEEYIFRSWKLLLSCHRILATMLLKHTSHRARSVDGVMGSLTFAACPGLLDIIALRRGEGPGEKLFLWPANMYTWIDKTSFECCEPLLFMNHGYYCPGAWTEHLLEPTNSVTENIGRAIIGTKTHISGVVEYTPGTAWGEFN